MSLQSYKHRIEEGGAGAPLLFTFHGTGGDEHQFPDLARDLLPSATIVSPRGDVSEGGALRFFRRTGEGVYDMDDLARRTQAMAGFIETQIAAHKPSAVLGLGYSNGANILASVMFARPALFDGAVLMHPLIPFQPKVDGSLEKTAILMTAGRKDPICPPNLTNRLESYLDGLGAELETVWHEGAHEVRPVEIDAARRFLSRWS